MKRLCVVMIMKLFFLSISTRSLAQVERDDLETSVISDIKIAVSFDKTTNLIFPYAVISVDRGSAAILAQKAKGVENILHLKAGKKNFMPTNMSVVTADGKFYSFMLHYEESPQLLTRQFGDATVMLFDSTLFNQEQLDREAYAVKVQPDQNVKAINKAGIRMELTGVFYSGTVVWFKVRLINSSPIHFIPAYTRFFLRDIRKAKRTAMQESELVPVYNKLLGRILPGNSAYFLLAYPSFIIQDGKRLFIQIEEKNEGRTLTMRIKQRALIKAGILQP